VKIQATGERGKTSEFSGEIQQQTVTSPPVDLQLTSVGVNTVALEWIGVRGVQTNS